MENITQFINSVGTRNLIIIGIIVVALIIALLIYRSLRLKVFRQEIVEIENHVNGIKTLPIQYRLGRVQSIAKNMKEVAEQYEVFAKDYDELMDFQKNEVDVLVNDVDEQLFYGRIRGINKKMGQLRVLSQDYDKRSHDLLARIEKVTEIENVQRVEIIRVKEKYREAGAQYDDIRFKVESFVPEINEIFKAIDEDFVRLEGMMNNQLFDDAKAFTAQIDGRIDRLTANMKDLPSYVSVVKQLLPNKVDKVEKLINGLSEDTYALEELKVEPRFEVIQDELTEATDLVKSVQIDEAGLKLQSLTDHIESLAVDLTKERESYKKFRSKWDKLSDMMRSISYQYEQCMVDYNRLETLYVMDEEEVTVKATYEDFKKDLEDYNDLKEKLDSGEFAYSDMLEKVETLTVDVNKHIEYLDKFISQRDSFYAIEQKAIDELENMNIVLLEIKSEIKNNHLPMINESYKDYIEDSYSKAHEIQKIREVRPISLKDLSQKVEGARDVIYKLYDNVHHLIVTAEMVEEAIIYGNRYRSSYLEVNTELTKAELLYRNGEYTKALTTAVDIIERIKPGSYEQLIHSQDAK